jgi:chemotaxis protein methyltransferase CheR
LGPEAYLETLTPGSNAMQDLFDRVTVQESSFFRHPGQFEALSSHVLPTLPGPVTIWSAGCANGQEAYSLAMVLDELGTEGSVIATDVSTKALQRTAAARYLTRELSGLSTARRHRYLVGGPDSWEVRPSLRDRVMVQRHNLIDKTVPQSSANCDVMFCRNVLIYFSSQQAKAFLARLAEQLRPGTYLFVGYAETIWQVPDLFEPVNIGGTFAFHRRGDHPRRAVPVLAPLAAARRPKGPAALRHPGSRRRNPFAHLSNQARAPALGRRPTRRHKQPIWPAPAKPPQTPVTTRARSPPSASAST